MPNTPMIIRYQCDADYCATFRCGQLDREWFTVAEMEKVKREADEDAARMQSYSTSKDQIEIVKA